ncbi:hypothetical protein NUW54_g1805 [Trametes sanguinea]|uniref:Uncharacterized protein n=2 Tax=Trametes sanguinea TaxID=158606 RepID=A0ACC1PWV9_9APHY|nr:hypothetical protein NUW54_g5470 [Trametes sanguinea]KAJ3012648.1 hypothetical protein NUW54_g1805 [Trametes sanguinea]
MPKDRASAEVLQHVRVAGPTHHASVFSRPSAREILRTIWEHRAIRGMGSESIEILAELRGETPLPPMDGDAHNFLAGNQDNDDAWEDVDESEDSAQEAITLAIQDVMAAYGGICHKADKRTWRNRVDNMEKNWTLLISRLTNVYLTWCYPPSPLVPMDVDPSYSFMIDVIDTYALTPSTTISQSADLSTAEALVRHGYLGNSPINPSLAILLKTLELFRCLKLVKASFSAEAFAKLVCYQYYIPYRPLYRTAITDVFDVYLSIQRSIAQRVMKSLGHNEPDWHARNGCPACFYVVCVPVPSAEHEVTRPFQLVSEKLPRFSHLIGMDSNNSLKRLATSGSCTTGDTRDFGSDYHLPRNFIDSFVHKVKSREKQPKANIPACGNQSDDDDEADDLSKDDTGDLMGGTTDSLTPCTSHWKVAASDGKKHMWDIFNETGIFTSACQHVLILWVADMVQSGEQAKYALATVAELQNTLGQDLMIAYDIGCDFSKAIDDSSLGPQARALRIRFCVNAFHGYSHSYNSDQISSLWWFGTPGMPLVTGDGYINQYFRQWDHEKYSNLGLMLYNNLRQALDIIQSQSLVLEQALESLQLSLDDLKRFSNEERIFFLQLRDEEDDNLYAVAYVEALQELRSASEELAPVSPRFNDKAPDVPTISWQQPRTGATDYNADLSNTRKLETRRRYLREHVKQLTAEVTELEVTLNIEGRWQPGNAVYQQTIQYMVTHKYQCALGKLQWLVILWLFELHKLNLAQTGYRMCTYITKNLQRHCKAIRNTVKEYNAPAQALDPPHETLDWMRVSHYSFFDKFTLLQDTRGNLRSKPWAQPHICETMRIARRITSACAEVENVN